MKYHVHLIDISGSLLAIAYMSILDARDNELPMAFIINCARPGVWATFTRPGVVDTPPLPRALEN